MNRTVQPDVGIERNYYPITEFVSLQDRGSSSAFTVATSQSSGVTSPGPGVVQIMMYRRLLNLGIPPLGMGENMDDKVPSQQVHRFFWKSFQDPLVQQARFELANLPVVLFANEAPKQLVSKFELDSHLHLLSFKSTEDAKIMVRVQNTDLSAGVGFDFCQLLNVCGAKSIIEMGLSFNQPYKDVRKGNVQRNLTSSTSIIVGAGMIRSYIVQI